MLWEESYKNDSADLIDIQGRRFSSSGKMKNRRKSESSNQKDDREKRKNECFGRNHIKMTRPT